MGKKKIIIAGVFVLIAGFLLFSSMMSRVEDEEDLLLYDGGGSESVVADLAIQGDEGILYIRKLKLILDNPTIGDMIDAVNARDEGVKIRLNHKGEIMEIEEYRNEGGEYWQILIDNKRVKERNVRQIPVENYDGITFIWG